MNVPSFADISAWQGAVDWATYRKWAASADGIARVSLRSSYGRGYIDAHYKAYRQGAVSAGVDILIHYHYAYPNLNRAIDEADWQHYVVGTIGPHDVVMLDYEENVPLANAEWAYEWLSRQEANYGGKLPTIYASDAFIRARLQDSRLSRFPLTLANWQFTPDERPPCPPPWSHYTYLQYSDRASIPGILGQIDANIYLGPHISPTPQEDTVTPLTINDVKSYFTVNQDGSWTRIDPKTGVALLDSLNKPIVLSGELLTDWCNQGKGVLAAIGLPTGNAIQPLAVLHPEIFEQEFERSVRRFDPKHIEDSPPGAGPVYSTHIENLYSAEVKLNMALDQLAATQKQLASLQTTSPESAYMAAVKAVKGIVDPLEVP